MKRIVPVFFLVVLFFTSACSQKTDHVVTIKTQYGNMVAILYDETPKHKANFIKLAKEHFYDSLLFHRVMREFMIQGGDPQSKKSPSGQPLGNGGPGYTIEAEINPKFFHEKGALAAARLGDQVNPTKASSGSQFYIVHGKVMKESEIKIDPQKFQSVMQQFFQKPENKHYYDSLGKIYQSRDGQAYERYLMSLKPIAEQQLGVSMDKNVSPELVKAYTTMGGAVHLDGQYTVFGKVIQGLEVIDKIAAVTTDRANRPTEDVRMMISVEEMPKKKIEKLYGYKYPEQPQKK